MKLRSQICLSPDEKDLEQIKEVKKKKPITLIGIFREGLRAILGGGDSK